MGEPARQSYDRMGQPTAVHFRLNRRYEAPFGIRFGRAG